MRTRSRTLSLVIVCAVASVCMPIVVYAVDPTVVIISNRLDSSARLTMSALAGVRALRLRIVPGSVDSNLVYTSYGRICSEYSISIDDHAPDELTIAPRDIATRYRNTEEADSVYRDFYTSIDVVHRNGHQSKNIDASLPMATEKCSRAEAIASESRQHVSTYGVIPEAPAAIWEDVLQPVVYIGAAVATVILLFTVRSH